MAEILLWAVPYFRTPPLVHSSAWKSDLTYTICGVRGGQRVVLGHIFFVVLQYL